MLSTRGGGSNSTTEQISMTEFHSSSSSSSSSLPPFSSSPLQTSSPTTKTMEEVWKDISLNDLRSKDPDFSLPHHHHHHTTAAASFRHMILQDFLTQPSTKDPPTTSNASSITDTPLLGYSGAPAAAPPPPTILSLNSIPELHFVDNTDPFRPDLNLKTKPVSNSSSFNSPFEILASTSVLPSFAKKRFQDSNNSSGDRRHKRMIKNRESAARSRARKQAYTNELELEVAHLLEENARLRKQQEQLCMDAAAQVPKKHTLHRTSTAPF